jgi:hypothetical protein
VCSAFLLQHKKGEFKIIYSIYIKNINEQFKYTDLCLTNLNNAIIHLDLLAQVSSTTLTDALHKNPRQFLWK